MSTANPKVDAYLAEGCGRCPLGGTPECKVNDWQEELKALRRIVLDCGLNEDVKWGVPCYTHQKRNIVMVGAFKDYCMISFFKGALLDDPAGLLSKPGENTQAGRLVRFTEAQAILGVEPQLKGFIHQAIEAEKAGLKVQRKSVDEYEMPQELQAKLDESPEFKAAFEALTPGRRKGYLLHFSGAKQSKTRAARIEKHAPRILEGKGMHDRD